MAKERFDVTYREHGPTLDYHFCREWDGDGGCYGTNPDHGLTFAQAKAEIVAWHEHQAKRWRGMSLKAWRSE